MKIFATKKGTVQYYDESNIHRVATVLEFDKTIVAKNEIVGGEVLVHFALYNKKPVANKPVRGQYKEVESFSKIVTSIEKSEMEVSKEVDATLIKEDDLVNVYSRTKGKGFAGTIKRHGFHRGPKSHGSRNYRRPGSIGDTGPQRVIKGKKMAGHMGFVNKTMKNVKVIKKIDSKKQIWLRGHIPGPKGSMSVIEIKND